MAGVLTSRQQSGAREISDSDKLEPVEPAYYKPVTPSPVSSRQRVPSEPVTWKAPVVIRGQRRKGMRYLQALGAVRQPLSPLGTGPDLGVAVWSSEFQPDQVQRHDAGFNDALFQAGYPGFNLGLSFKVPKLPTSVDGPGYAMRMRSPNIRVTINKQTRSVSASMTG